MKSRFLVAAAALAGVMTPACAIPDRDPLPGLGAPCVVAEGSCDLEHVCRPDEAGADVGVCIPVGSYGACDADEPVKHAPGRRGEARVDDDITIDGPEDLALLEDLRAVTGLVRVFKQGAGDVVIGSLCAFRDLQQAGDGVGIGDSDITSLDGLQSLTSIGHGLVIFDNGELTNLDGLGNLVDLTPRPLRDFAALDLIIAGNGSLADEVVDAFVAGLEERMGRELAVVACNNAGRPCEGTDAQLLSFLVTNGVSTAP